MSTRTKDEVLPVIPVPEFPEFRPVQLEDYEYVDHLLRLEQPKASELTFANIYLWRNSYDFRIAAIAGGVVIFSRDHRGQSFYFPPIGVENKVSVIRQLLSDPSSPGCLCRVEEELAKQLEAEGFDVEYDRDNSDYVYRSEDLVHLAGRKYHRKKNHIAQFRNKYDYEYRRVDADLVQQCADLQVEWCDIRDCFVPENRSLAEEHDVILECLQLLEKLELTAGAIIIDGKVQAFAVSGYLNEDTLVMHFEKASPAYPGLYQVINKEFSSDAAVDSLFVNREQDLGEPGLRKAKESYFPDHLVNKYVVRLPGLS